jgi:putative transposase
MYPTLEQRAILNKWKDTHRYVYNKTLEYSNKNKEYNFQNLRNALVSYKTETGINPNIQLWELETPKDIRASAIDDVVSSLKGNFTRLNKKSISSFNIRFRRKKSKSYSFGVPKTALEIVNKTLNVYTTFFKNVKVDPNIKLGKRTPNNINVNHDSKIHYKHGNYFLLLTTSAICKFKSQSNDIIALDPGVRTFQTGYSMKEIVSFRRDPELINKLKNKIAILQTNRKFKKIQKYYDRINNIVDDLHWRTISYLTKNYYNVLLPHFESQEMLVGLTKKTRYNINSLKHYQFKQRLIYKSNHTKTRVFLVNEAYTTKTCGRCGVINNSIGGSKIFECNSCKLKIDRDFNGARNILLKHLNLGALMPI